MQYDLVVIGTGSAGSTAAMHCREAGWSVAVVDSRPYGGTCALRGCDPKKILVGAADLVDWTGRMRKKGVVDRENSINWNALIRFKNTFTDPFPAQKEARFKNAGIDTFHGEARFVGKNSIAVGNDTLEARHVVIATGATPMKLGMEGEELLTDSDEFLNVSQLPKRVIFVGGGYVSMEFAHIAARAGARVAVLHRGARILEKFDADLVQGLTKATEETGIDLHLNTHVERIEKREEEFVVHAVGAASRSFKADLVVHGAGRVPDIAHLDLEKGEVQTEKGGIAVDEFLQSVTNPAVYAAGDAGASGGFPLTPIADLEGDVVAANLLGASVTPDYRATPTVVFTLPPLASVGITEEEARKKGVKFRVNFQNTSGWYSSRRINQEHSASKVLVEEGSGKILGAHILGHNAEEMINILAIAMRYGLTADDLKNTIWAYPTNASDITYMV